MTPDQIIDTVQKAANLKTHAAAVHITEILKNEAHALSPASSEPWYKETQIALKEIIDDNSATLEPYIFQRRFSAIVTSLLSQLKQEFMKDALKIMSQQKEKRSPTT
jgi:hypothetical protein